MKTLGHHKTHTWASADFFPGKSKNFPGGGQEPTFCLKNNKKILFQKKSKNIIFLAGLGRLGGQEPPPLRMPMNT